MGSCISTCRPKKPPQEEDQDQDLYDPEVETLVPIKLSTQDQAPKTTPTTPISPPSPSSSLSSFSCNTTSTNASCSSSLSSTSSNASSSLEKALSFKDRAFSNEFLRTCIKDNPHIVKEKGRPGRHVVQVLAPAKQSMSPKRATPQKRVRSSSPNNLTRQKSFRKDPSPPDHLSSYYAPSRSSLRSPSPSRRFNKVNPNPNKALSLTRNKENLRPTSPGRVGSYNYKSGLRNREALSLSKDIGGLRFGEGKGSVCDDHDVPMEDIDNPLISLDCFIFL